MTGAATTVRVAVLGAGRIGLLHAANARDRVPGLDVAVVADPQAAARERVAAELGVPTTADWQQAVADAAVDAVLVCSPTDLHAEQVRAAADAGKPVFCEKPLDVDLASVDGLLAHVAARRVPLQVGFNRRFDPSVAALRERLARGALGALWSLRLASRDPEPPPASYVAHAGGLLVDMAIHDFDTVRFLTGADVDEVIVRAAANLPETPPGEVDTAVTLLRLESGTLATIDNCRRSTHGYDQRVEAHGEHGTAFVGNVRAVSLSVADAEGLHRPPPPHFFLERYQQSYLAELAAFRDACHGAEVTPSGEDGRQALRIAHAATRSLADGRPVRLVELAAGSPSSLP